MFSLDARLQADTLFVDDLPLCRVLLMNDARYPWCILVPRRDDIGEVFELPQQEQQQLWQESTLLAGIMRQMFNADKMNIATLGNVVRQLHMHVIARKTDDDAWPAPVWGKHASLSYAQDQAAVIIRQLRHLLTQQ